MISNNIFCYFFFFVPFLFHWRTWFIVDVRRRFLPTFCFLRISFPFGFIQFNKFSLLLYFSIRFRSIIEYQDFVYIIIHGGITLICVLSTPEHVSIYLFISYDSLTAHAQRRNMKQEFIMDARCRPPSSWSSSSLTVEN